MVTTSKTKPRHMKNGFRLFVLAVKSLLHIYIIKENAYDPTAVHQKHLRLKNRIVQTMLVK